MTKQNSKPQNKNRRRLSPTSEEALKLVRSLPGRNGIYGMTHRNDRGNIVEVGVYNYNTKQYALYNTDMVDQKALDDIKSIIG